MKLIKVFLAAGLLLVAGGAVAGKGGPIASGYWMGDGQAIYPDGTVAEIISVAALLSQDGNFIYGGAEFHVIINDGDPVVQQGQISAHISGNQLKGVMGGCLTVAPDCLGVGVIEGKLSGNMLRGTVMDLSDGSTSVITLHRMVD
ncbi:MAG: hypothetical protein V2I36_20015 [Desulfopila sp.]|jgi:hypothetical protein|nr:hypothetical protein [Desulfopila sp.]